MHPDHQTISPVRDENHAPATVRFSVSQWGAWAPGLESPEAWHRWARGEATIGGEGEPRVVAMPPMLRRRAERLGRMALETAYAATGGQGMIPTVFCSRHGDVGRTCEMLMALARKEILSPTAFSLSVHNAIGGLFSIASGSNVPFTAIAGGAASVVSGVIEACGLLADGAPEVLLVMYDEPLPAIYQPYRDEPEHAYAWSWRMTPASGEAFSMTCEVREDEALPRPSAEPLALEVLRFFLSGMRESTMERGKQVWRWRRHA
jgi:hypothetical protein